MPRYRARYVSRTGRRSSVVLDAVDAESICENIEGRQRAFVIEIERVAAGRGALARTRVPSAQLLAALDALELMLTSGVRVNAALRTIADSSPGGPSRRLWTEVARLLEENGGFCEALRQFPRVFNAPMLGVIAAHEMAGRLGDGVRHARDYVAQMQEIRRESVHAAAYPALICTAALASSLVLCLYTLPRFSKMLGDIGVTRTNRITGFFFGLSALVAHHPAAVALVLSAPPALAWAALRPRFRPRLDRLVLRVPLVRGAVEALCMSRICITYRALSESGIRVVEALDCCAAAAGNAVYAAGLRRVIQSVRENAPVGSGFEDAGVFAPEVVLAIKGGDGALPQVFGRLADFYRSESRHRAALALRMIEPAMLVLVLAWVFGITLAVVLPVVEVVNEIH
jgi:type II secretory pathway component PulF